jgi:ribonucleoside-diphosphate reductase beta chain
VARDESRHVVFGVKFLRDMIRRDNALAHVVDAAIDKYAPIAIRAISPNPNMVPRILALGGDPWLSPRYAMDSLTKKLRVVGLRISSRLPEIPPPPVFGA